MLITNANIWIAAYVSSEPEHMQSKRWLRRTIRSGEQIAAPRILLLEVIAALERTNNARYRVALERQIQDVRMRWTPVDDELIERAIRITTEIKLKSLDTLYVAVAEQLNIPLYTWDEEVLRRASERIRVYKPN